jgi:Peptidase C39 family
MHVSVLRRCMALLCVASVIALVFFRHSISLLSSDPVSVGRQLYKVELRLLGGTVTSYESSRLQRSTNDCSVAILREVLRLRHRVAPADSVIAQELNLRVEGTTLGELSSALSAHGVNNLIFRGRSQRRPAERSISLLSPSHFVLVLRTSAEDVEFFDPLVGGVTLPMVAYTKRWTGKEIRLLDQRSKS